MSRRCGLGGAFILVTPCCVNRVMGNVLGVGNVLGGDLLIGISWSVGNVVGNVWTVIRADKA